MLTNNFRQALRGVNSSTRNPDSIYTNTATLGILSSIAGTSITVGQFDGISSGTSYYLIVGSGSTMPTITDAGLDTIITDLSYVSGSTSRSGSDTLIRHVDSTYKNNTESSITVRELGVGIQTRNSQLTNSYSFLIAREVLDTPVVIMPGKSYTFAWELNM